MTTKKEKPMKLEVKKINTKQYESKEEREKKHNKVEDKKKVKMTKKAKTWPRKITKTEAKVNAKSKQFTWSRREIKADDEKIQHLLIWRPRTFKSPQHLLELFNEYLRYCMKKTRKAELVPIRTEEKSDDLLDSIQEAAQAVKNDNSKIENTIVAEYEIIEDIEWKTTPSKGGFLIYCWWLTYSNFDNYKNFPEFQETISLIENTLETILVTQAAQWKYNQRIAEFILNTHYNRVPKSKSEEVIKTDIIDESELIQN